MPKLTDFMISRVRGKLYKIFFDNPTEMFYVRQLTRMTSEEINAVRRELARMEKKGVVKCEKRGNRLYYFVNQAYDYYEDLLSLVAKSTGIGLALRKQRRALGKIKFAMLSGTFVRRKERDAQEVDLLIVGGVTMPLLTAIIQDEEKRRQTEINYTVMTSEEFVFRKNRRDPFLLGVLSRSRIMIIGDEEGLVDKSFAQEQAA